MVEGVHAEVGRGCSGGGWEEGSVVVRVGGDAVVEGGREGGGWEEGSVVVESGRGCRREVIR